MWTRGCPIAIDMLHVWHSLQFVKHQYYKDYVLSQSSSTVGAATKDKCRYTGALVCPCYGVVTARRVGPNCIGINMDFPLSGSWCAAASVSTLFVACEMDYD